MSTTNSKVKKESVYHLSDAELKAVNKGLEDIKKGRVYTSEQANDLIRKWLKR